MAPKVWKDLPSQPVIDDASAQPPETPPMSDLPQYAGYGTLTQHSKNDIEVYDIHF